ncbi:hypothetical protein I1E95_01505 [Synechococcus sp. CBW1107]|uniref:hypothetical protein n=1 Tax=Synechococcus sp. CBW1107 TaxID=2789857 RepID=UPI0018CF7BF1|nr:hypothetical protein [Synechococcus sp. CBW1107]QPN56890.1 hypothetical protein I1E95_01505 [Synechococcus sp. CBW1107]CAK6695487.1 hypothetical protein BBFGKLBO_01857 [Synechococcus sp. CBW1107]
MFAVAAEPAEKNLANQGAEQLTGEPMIDTQRCVLNQGENFEHVKSDGQEEESSAIQFSRP